MMATAGSVALVTGAASGIGAAVAWELATQGISVAVADSNTQGVTELADKITAERYSAWPYGVDVTSAHQVEEMVSRVESESGPIDILVNVAGILRTAPIVDLSDEDWNAVFAVNAFGVFNMSRAVARRMRQRCRGAIVTVASNASAVPRMHMAAYCASKAAATLFTKCLGLELAEYGVRCNVVAPGSTDTPMLQAMWTADYDATSVIAGAPERYRIGIPLRRLAQPEDVAQAVAYLASDRARHITMHELCVDGGATLGV